MSSAFYSSSVICSGPKTFGSERGSRLMCVCTLYIILALIPRPASATQNEKYTVSCGAWEEHGTVTQVRYLYIYSLKYF